MTRQCWLCGSLTVVVVAAGSSRDGGVAALDAKVFDESSTLERRAKSYPRQNPRPTSTTKTKNSMDSGPLAPTPSITTIQQLGLLGIVCR